MTLAILARFWKPLAGAGLLALIAWQIHAYGERREQEGRDAVMALWAADTLERDKAASDAIAAARAAQEAQRKHNEVIESEYQARLASIAADRDDTFRLLQQARGAVSACSSNRATDSLIAAQRSAADRGAAIDAAVAGVVTEHRMNAEQLNRLIGLLRSQTVCPIRVE